jgi:hypothetical protein
MSVTKEVIKQCLISKQREVDVSLSMMPIRIHSRNIWLHSRWN